MSTAIYIKIASGAIRTSSTIECHQEPFSFPSGSSESPTPTSARSARVVRMDGWMGGDQKGLSIFLIFKYVIDNVYMYLYMYSKVVTKILMGFKI